MKIFIDASRALHPQPTGIEVYCQELIGALLQLPEAAEHEWVLLTPRLPDNNHRLHNLPSNAHWLTVPGKYGWTLGRLSLFFATHKSSNSVLFVPGHIFPYVTPPRTVITVHDFGFRYYPEGYGRLGSWWMNHELVRSVRKASAIIAPSHSTAQDLKKFYDIRDNEIHVIPHGADHLSTTGQALKSKAIVMGKYFLVTGRLELRKNTSRILEAFAALCEINTNSPQLVFAGRFGQGAEEIRATFASLPEEVRARIQFLGHVDRIKLTNLLINARALIYPSLYEGFGIPALEAMQAGIPVLTSTTSSLPEAVGDAAILVDPLSVPDITQGMLIIDQDGLRRKNLIAKGKTQAAQFTWEKAALKTMKVLISQ